jgi:UrcA family protein
MSHSILTRRISAVAFAFAYAGFAPTLFADVGYRDEATQDVIVRYDDLNLQAQAGAKALVNRIATAATKVCGGRQDFRRMLMARLQFEACRTTAMQSAVARVNHPVVTAIYEKKQSADKRLASR